MQVTPCVFSNTPSLVTDALGEATNHPQYAEIFQACGQDPADEEYCLCPIVKPLTLGSHTFAPGAYALVGLFVQGHDFWIVEGV